MNNAGVCLKGIKVYTDPVVNPRKLLLNVPLKDTVIITRHVQQILGLKMGMNLNLERNFGS